MSQQPYYASGGFGGLKQQPVVVQGTVVGNQELNNAQAQIYNHNAPGAGIGANANFSSPHEEHADAEEGNWTKGETQPRRCNDVAWAVIFYIHLGVMGWAAATYTRQMYAILADGDYNGGGDRMLEEGEGDEENEHSLSTVVAFFLQWANGALQWASDGLGNLFVYGKDKYDTVRENRALEGGDDENYIGTDDFGDMILLLGISAVISFIISTGALSFMISHAQVMIKFALGFNIVATGLYSIGALFISPFAAIMGLFMFALTIYYAYVVWDRIPFAACNLVSATTAVRANLGLAFFAYGSLLFMFGWSVWWLATFVSTVYVTGGCNAQGECEQEANGILVFFMTLSYHWTYQVIKNTVHVTVAGTVGTWWFAPHDASSFCSTGVRDSFFRSISNSFGSICFGSLIVAIIETAKNMLRNMRQEGEGNILLCVLECLCSLLEDIIEYFNTWAFVFVGLYGYTFFESGKNVINLFKTRGWTTIITDNLAQSVLTMVSAGVGLITGLISLIIAHARGMVFGDELGGAAMAFFIGFIIGFVITSTLMTIVSSALNTVIVCYAEAPAEFQANHPELADEMRASWSQAWPAEFKY